MVWKNTAFFIGFFLLIFFNVFITLKVSAQSRRAAATTRLLSDIEHARDNYKEFSSPSAPLVLGAYQASFETGDARAANLRAFFREISSPLYEFADDMVRISDKYNLDYRLLAAISMQESTGCKFIPHDSYNCWGYGIYGTTVTRFSSYVEGMETVAKGLKENYVDKGLITPKQIMSRYTPSSNGSWEKGVSKVWGWIE